MKMIATLAVHSLAFCLFGCATGTTAASSHSTQLAPAALAVDDEERDDEWVSDCRQELGSDSGDAHRAHPIVSGEWVSGCFVDGDDVDAFVLAVPVDQRGSTYHFELVHRGGAALNASILDANGTSLSSLALVEGAELMRAVNLAPGSRALLRVAKEAGSANAWYRLKATAVTQVSVAN